jgi:hypothetical protein
VEGLFHQEILIELPVKGKTIFVESATSCPMYKKVILFINAIIVNAAKEPLFSLNKFNGVLSDPFTSWLVRYLTICC